MTKPITISRLNREIKYLIETNFNFVFVTGEISNFKKHTSGHFYFTLKDERSQISANMWSSNNERLIFTPENGMRVIVKGRVTVYDRGTYQIDVFEMEPAGEGDLQIAFEKLKQKLHHEGLFDQSLKKSLPEFPARVGIITSETGAALQDFIRVTNKRFPNVKIFLINAQVQGRAAAWSICRAIKFANNFQKENPLDIIVLARGGGSIEDLWCFNEERVAREIFSSVIPVVSAIGHEIDFTISDFVADLRAPTPSAAAEMIFPDMSELIKKLRNYETDIATLVRLKFDRMNNSLNNISNNYYFKKPKDILNEYKLRIDDMEKKLNALIKEKSVSLGGQLDTIEKLFNTLNPENVLKRGFTIVTKNEKIINRKAALHDRDKIKIKFYDGQTDAVVKDEENLKLGF